MFPRRVRRLILFFFEELYVVIESGRSLDHGLLCLNMQLTLLQAAQLRCAPTALVHTWLKCADSEIVILQHCIS
jgi:hypothetical protein